MLEVNYKILPRKIKQARSIGARSVHNSFYTAESHWETSITDYHGIYADDYFELRSSDESNENHADAQERSLPE